MSKNRELKKKVVEMKMGKVGKVVMLSVAQWEYLESKRKETGDKSASVVLRRMIDAFMDDFAHVTFICNRCGKEIPHSTLCDACKAPRLPVEETQKAEAAAVRSTNPDMKEILWDVKKILEAKGNE